MGSEIRSHVKKEDLRHKVGTILADYPRARGDDAFLYTLYIYEYYPQNCIERPDGFYINLCAKHESPETITRVRRWYNERGEYLATETKQKRRKIKQAQDKKDYGHGPTLAEICRMDYEFNQIAKG